MKIDALADADSITNSAKDVSISGGADSIQITGSSVSRSVERGSNFLITVGSAATSLHFIGGANAPDAVSEVTADSYSVVKISATELEVTAPEKILVAYGSYQRQP